MQVGTCSERDHCTDATTGKDLEPCTYASGRGNTVCTRYDATSQSFMRLSPMARMCYLGGRMTLSAKPKFLDGTRIGRGSSTEARVTSGFVCTYTFFSCWHNCGCSQCLFYKVVYCERQTGYDPVACGKVVYLDARAYILPCILISRLQGKSTFL